MRERVLSFNLSISKINPYIFSNDQNEKFIFSHDFCTIIKGIALILMVIHHCFGFPHWYAKGIISFPELKEYVRFFSSSPKICVGIFAFLSGFTYYLHKDKSYTYSIKKIINFLTSYWIVLVFTIILAVLFSNYETSISKLKYEFFPYKNHPLMIFVWYVIFYIQFMLILPIFAQLTTNKDLANTVALAFLFIFTVYFFKLSRHCGWLPPLFA